MHIERLTVNVANAGGVVLNFNESSIPDDVRQKIAELLKNSRA